MRVVPITDFGQPLLCRGASGWSDRGGRIPDRPRRLTLDGSINDNLLRCAR